MQANFKKDIFNIFELTKACIDDNKLKRTITITISNPKKSWYAKIDSFDLIHVTGFL